MCTVVLHDGIVIQTERLHMLWLGDNGVFLFLFGRFVEKPAAD